MPYSEQMFYRGYSIKIEEKSAGSFVGPVDDGKVPLGPFDSIGRQPIAR